jgi:hypothetical protein
VQVIKHDLIVQLVDLSNGKRVLAVPRPGCG